MSNVGFVVLVFGTLATLSSILKQIASIKSLLEQMHKDITDLKQGHPDRSFLMLDRQAAPEAEVTRPLLRLACPFRMIDDTQLTVAHLQDGADLLDSPHRPCENEFSR